MGSLDGVRAHWRDIQKLLKALWMLCARHLLDGTPMTSKIFGSMLIALSFTGVDQS